MISYDDIPHIVADKAGIKNASEFNAIIEKECGTDERKQHEFMCKWIKDWLKNNKLIFVLAEICDRDEMAEFMCFVADYIEAFDFNLQDMICDYADHFGGKKVEAAYHAIIQANQKKRDVSAGPSKASIADIDEEEQMDHEAILNKELQGLTNDQLLELMTTVFGNDEYNEEFLPEIEDCIAHFEVILDENGWGNDVLMEIVKAIQSFKNNC